MKKLSCWAVVVAVALASGTAVVAQEKGAPAAKAPAAKAPATPIEKASYGIGLNIGRGMKSDGLEVDVKFLVQGVMDAIEGKESVLTEAQLREAFQTVQKELQAKQLEKAKMAGDKNKKDGEAFLATNKKKQGITTTESGLQYQVLKSGKGASPKATDQVRTHYHGTLIDGKVFDSSVDRGEPVTFPVNGVIKGWTEALQLMKVGDKWKVFVPSALAYGERGAGADIGPNAVLVFEIELLGIE
ncbi:MAG: FKBP-type peptidyl-prolyl cis-trans isomerase [Pirellulales bacterium]